MSYVTRSHVRTPDLVCRPIIVWSFAVACLMMVFPSLQANADVYPSKPIRMIIPFGPGGGLEIQARLLAQKMSETWKQQVVLDFRAGAAGNIGNELAAKAPPDGYTLLLSVSNMIINPLIYANTKYDVNTDFVPLSLVGSAPQVLVGNAAVPSKTLADLIALSKSSRLTYAITGIGSVGHLAAELFSAAAGITMTSVPYKGSGAAAVDLLGGHVQLMFAAPGSMLQHLKSGKLKAFAVTSKQREVEGLEDVPTFVEAGYPTVVVYNWFGMFAPAGTPQTIVTKLNREIVRVVNLSDVKEKIVASGYLPITTTPKEFSDFLRVERVKWEKLVKATGIRVN